MDEPTTISTIAHLIQLAIAPVFLLAGIGAILNVMANRLARVVDRVRDLESHYAGSPTAEQALARDELGKLSSRMTLVNWSITGCTASALFVCLVVAILFVGGLADRSFGRPIAVLFIIAMLLLIGSLVLFLLEIRIAAHTLRVHHELLGGSERA